MKINICIPVFNEEENLPSFIKSLDSYLSSFYNKNFELNVVFYNDGSSDNSLEILKKTEYEVISELNNKGLGKAISTLFEYSIQDNVDGVIKLDCDGQMDINDIDLYLQKIEKEPFDLLQGNRFEKSNNFKLSFFKKLGIIFFRLIFRFLGMKIKDSSNGFIYVSKKWLEDFKVIGHYNAAQQILLDTKLRGLNYSEVNVTIENRKSGKSFVGIRYPFNVISSMIGLIVYRRTNKILTIPGIVTLLAALFLLINDVFLWMRQIEEKIISNQITVLMFIIGTQLLSLGLVTEFLKKQKII